MLSREIASLRSECNSAIDARNAAERASNAAERQATQYVAANDAKSAREQQHFAIRSRHREQAAKAEARRLRAALFEAEATLNGLWNANVEQRGHAEDLIMLLPEEEIAAGIGAIAVEGPSSWLSLAPPPFASHHPTPFGSPISASGKKHHGPSLPAETFSSATDDSGMAPLSEEAAAVAIAAARAKGSLVDAHAHVVESSEFFDEATEAEVDRALAASIATTRAVWDARRRLLAVATGHAATAARREGDLVVLSEEMSEIELRAKVHRVRANGVQSRLRTLLRSLHTWRTAAVMVVASAASTDHDHAARWVRGALVDTSGALEEVASTVGGQVEAMHAMELVHNVLSSQAESLQLATASIAVEAEVHAAAEARNAIQKAEEQRDAAEAKAKAAFALRDEMARRLKASDAELRSACSAAQLAEVESARRQEEAHSRYESAAAAASQRLSDAMAEAARLEGEVSALENVGVSMAAQKGVSEKAMENQAVNLTTKLEVERAATEKEAGSVREAVATIANMRDALTVARATADENSARAAGAEARIEILKHEVDDAKAGMEEAIQRAERSEEALQAANEKVGALREQSESLDAETEALRVTTSAIIGARESAIARELQLDEGLAELSQSLVTARQEKAAALDRVKELVAYVAEVEQMVLVEANQRRDDEYRGTEREEGLLGRIAQIEAKADRAEALEAEIARAQAAHELAISAAKDLSAASREAAKADAARAADAEAEVMRLRASSDQLKQSVAAARTSEEAAKEAVVTFKGEAEAARRREADLLGEMRGMSSDVGEAEAARGSAERRLKEALAERADAVARVEELSSERKGMIAREVAAQQEATDLAAELREMERQKQNAESTTEAEAGRVEHLEKELNALMRTVHDGRTAQALADETAAASRSRERAMDEAAEMARRELEVERATRISSDLKLDQAHAENASLTARLHGQLEREREGRTAAERRASERTISLQAELQEAQRETLTTRRNNEKLRNNARAAAAAYCLRLLVGRHRDGLARSFARWSVACAESEAADRVYAVEERAKQQLMLQAHSFQVRLEALEYPT